jgi:hypothetical protein
MKQYDGFNISRLGLLLKMELFKSRKGLLITVVITFGLLFTGLILESIFGTGKASESFDSGYMFFLLTGGFVLSSLAFNELAYPLKRPNYLMLPASAFEKFLSMWLLTCLGWIVLFTMTFLIYTWIAGSIEQLFFRSVSITAFNPFGHSPLVAMRIYIVCQAIFLVGAVHFRGYAFPKILFTILLFGMLCGLIFYLVMANLLNSGVECGPGCNPLKNPVLFQFWQVTKWMMWWVTAPLCWVITFLGLKEQEV